MSNALEKDALTFLLQNALSGLDECQDVGVRLAVPGEWDGRRWPLRGAEDNRKLHITAPYIWTLCLPFQSAFRVQRPDLTQEAMGQGLASSPLHCVWAEAIAILSYANTSCPPLP